MINSYPKIYNLGHPMIKELFNDPVSIEEKVDGSQFSFGMFNGDLKCRSKGCLINTEAPEKLFTVAIEAVKQKAHLLKDGYTYVGEYLRTPSHNTLKYSRVPKDHIIIFDIKSGYETYLSKDERLAEAERIGFECVPVYDFVKISSVDDVIKYMNSESVLGGVIVEGLVFKNYQKFGTDSKVMMGKHVSESFKEVHGVAWKSKNPTQTDIIDKLSFIYKTDARYLKAIQKLRDSGQLTETPKDIGLIIKEVSIDIDMECKQEIMEALHKWAWPKVSRNITKGLPEFYKAYLMENQFKE